MEVMTAISSSETGRVVVFGDTHAELTSAVSGGGARVMTQVRIVRTRASVDTELVNEYIYGPRGLSYNSASTNSSFADATKHASAAIAWTDEAQEGDVFKLQARCVFQAVGSGATIEFSAANNGLMLFGV